MMSPAITKGAKILMPNGNRQGDISGTVRFISIQACYNLWYYEKAKRRDKQHLHYPVFEFILTQAKGTYVAYMQSLID
jgi:hypothetical protein